MNIVNVLNDAKKEHRLKMNIKRQQDALQKLQEEHDIWGSDFKTTMGAKKSRTVELLKSADEERPATAALKTALVLARDSSIQEAAPLHGGL
ncbi:hypothetical protein MTO96_037708 [Rhipicephalus appendiculatus]